jgi:hypothetical protein
LCRETSAIAVHLEYFVCVFPVLDAHGVEVQELFECPGLGPFLAFFHVIEGGYTDSRQLADLHLGQHGLPSKGFEPITVVIVKHPLISH